jgi:hypothetical protein
MRIYIASKAKYASRWRELRASGVPIISSWIDWDEPKTTDGWRQLWELCVSEAAAADVLILYEEPGDVLKGALVETGICIGAGNRVYFAGERGRHSIVNHPRVTVFGTIEDAVGAAMSEVT